MTQPLLFQPLALRSVTLPNRVSVAPMCQYSAKDGIAQDWHLQHYGALAASGPGLVVMEATGVSPEGRISPHCLGLYNDATEAALTRLVKALKSFGGGGAIATQLAHAGRKGGAATPWEGGKFSKDGWPTISASNIPFDTDWPAPAAASTEDLARLKACFVEAARRSLRVGFDLIELHSAHGYLLHQFLSPLSNRRNDGYGGSLDNRMRFPLEVVEAVRAAWPADKPMGIRISTSDWAEGGWTVDESVIYAKAFAAAGIDYVCVSSGGLVPYAKIPFAAGYQIPFARRVREACGIPTRAVGLIASPQQAEATLAEGSADMIAVGRGFLDNPRWVWHAAEALGADMSYPPQYLAVRGKIWPGAAIARPQAAE
ncbi:NADPH dehydrogenase [Candidatus Terasakiella magnetica]|nr:NADPH dehydrogenase [Candidatus Terasakiella magnetica]